MNRLFPEISIFIKKIQNKLECIRGISYLLKTIEPITTYD